MEQLIKNKESLRISPPYEATASWFKFYKNKVEKCSCYSLDTLVAINAVITNFPDKDIFEAIISELDEFDFDLKYKYEIIRPEVKMIAEIKSRYTGDVDLLNLRENEKFHKLELLKNDFYIKLLESGYSIESSLKKDMKNKITWIEEKIPEEWLDKKEDTDYSYAKIYLHIHKDSQFYQILSKNKLLGKSMN